MNGESPLAADTLRSSDPALLRHLAERARREGGSSERE
jgi:hypothetical protein